MTIPPSANAYAHPAHPTQTLIAIPSARGLFLEGLLVAQALHRISECRFECLIADR